MRCIIIDDDELARLVIEKYIKKTDFLTIIGSFSNAFEAINFIKQESSIDLIFLDIEMPEMTGIEFLKSLSSLPQIIITSAKQKYALEAFEYDVTDYLLKPISYPRLYKAVDKAHQRFQEMETNKEENDGFFIKSASSLIRLKYKDIMWVEALENYVGINTYENKFTIHFTMKAIENELPSNVFQRVHRSYIVNINKINLIEDNSIIMETSKGTKTIPIGKSYRDNLMNDINVVLK